MQEFVCSISRKDLQDLADLAMQVYRNPDELPFTYFRPIRDRLFSWGFDAIKDAQAVMYLGRGDYDSYQIARNDLEDSGGSLLRLRSTASIRFRLENIFKPGFRR